jgi:AraC family transcriptional regulator
MQNAIDFIENRLRDELSPEMIAQEVCMSAFHFQRLFSIFFGISLGEYIRNRRLSLAAAEIRLTDKKIIEIAFQYAYESPESFSRAFYRYYGVTPSAARSRKSDLKPFPKISVKSILSGDNMMTDLGERGYTVKENQPVYYTRNMDATVKWFKDILGWYGGIDARDESGTGTYGCVLPIPGELVHMQITTFNGIHLFPGEPEKRESGLILVDSIDKFHAFVKGNGWEEITEIKHQSWGARLCSVTTIDGTVLNFFELD